MLIDKEIAERIRSEKGYDLITDVSKACDYIKDGMTIGVSGFTPADDPKIVPLELAKRAQNGKKIKVDIYSGGALGPVDGEMAAAGLIRKRLPFTHNPVIRKEINSGNVQYTDIHLSQVPQMINYGFLGKIDLAVVEVLAVTEDGNLIPSIAVGNTQVVVDAADEVIVEIAMKKSMKLEGMHDVYTIDNPPHRREIPVYSPNDRIGVPYIRCGWDKIKAIVLSDAEDRPHKMTEPDDVSKKIAENVLDFFKKEISEGRLPENLYPIQSGLGNVGNAMLKELKTSGLKHLSAYTEVIQDGMLELIENGTMDFASASCLTLSKEGYENFYENIDFYRKRMVLRPQEISNNPEIIRRLGIISINTALEADIYGNINSSHIMGKRMVNGIGGSGDFARNSSISIFTTPSITRKGDISCIVPMCAHIDHTEHDVMVIVTEQGYADLRGLSPKERAIRIIENCAHPDYRDKLMDYFQRACGEELCQTPQILEEALSWHCKYEKTGSMK